MTDVEIKDISGTQYLDLVNLESSPRDNYSNLSFYRLNGELLAHLHTWSGSFISKKVKEPTNKKERLKVLEELQFEVEGRALLESRKFRPTGEVFTPINSWPMTGEKYVEKGR